MPNKRWIAIALLVLAAGLAALALFESTSPTQRVPKFTFADAGPLRLVRPPSSFTLQGAPLPTALVTPTTTSACLSGTIVDAVTGQGVPHASITFGTFAGAITTTADASGRFELERLLEGVVTVAEVSAPHHFPFRPAWGASPLELRLVDGACVTGLTLSLLPRVEYAGEVLDPGGAPVEGARVTIANEQEPPDTPLLTGPDGRFRFHATDGSLIVATHPRFLLAVALVDFRVSTTRHVTLRFGSLPPDAGPVAVDLSGRVLDEHDAGVPGASLRVTRTLATPGGTWERLEATAESDATGAFHFALDAPGPWRVSAATSTRVSRPVETTGGHVVLRLDHGASLSGTVRDDLGHPLTSFTLLTHRLLGTLQRDTFAPHHVIDPEGRFHLAGLAAGRYEVTAVAAGLAPSSPEPLDLEPGAERTLELRLTRGATVSGTVVERGSQRPLPGARVSLEQTRDEPIAAVPIARTDERGRFTLLGLPEGLHSLFVAADGHHARLVSVELRRDAPSQALVIDLGPVPDGGTPQLELVGIGAVLKASGDVLVLERIVEGGGAAEAGLLAGDLVLAIDGAATSTLGFAGAIERIRGAEDTTVTLEVKREGGAVERVVVPRRRISR